MGGDRPIAFITGASRGIGRGIAVELARAGFDIAGNGRSGGAALGETEAQVRAAGGAFAAVPGDVADLRGHAGLVAAVLERFGRIDLFVSNAGVAPIERRDILDAAPESFDRVLGINLRGAFFLAQAAARQMVRQVEAAAPGEKGAAKGPGLPALVFISSISAAAVSVERSEYCISKAGLSSAAALFASRLASLGINVYEVRPGIVKTDMTAPAAARYDRLIGEGLVPQGRWALPEDVGRAVAALARGDFRFSTGMVVEVSGGMNLRRL